MNPVFVICVILAAVLLWIGIAFLFPVIGEFVRDYSKAMKGIIEEEDKDE